MKNKYRYNGEVITASSKIEAIKVVADKSDELYKKAFDEFDSLKNVKDVKFKLIKNENEAYGKVKFNKNYSIEYELRLKTDKPKPEFVCRVGFGDEFEEEDNEDNRSVLMQREIKIPSVNAGVDYIRKCIEASKKCFDAIMEAKSAIFDKKFKNGRYDDINED